MSSDVLARLPQVRQLSVPSTLVSLICHVPPRSHVYHVRKKKNLEIVTPRSREILCSRLETLTNKLRDAEREFCMVNVSRYTDAGIFR